MKRYIYLLLFAILIMISSCRRKCALCEVTDPYGNYGYDDVCRKDFDSKAEWEANIKLHEDIGAVCTEHR